MMDIHGFSQKRYFCILKITINPVNPALSVADYQATSREHGHQLKPPCIIVSRRIFVGMFWIG